MGLSDILASIDREIARLQSARTVLSGIGTSVTKRKAGRPRKTDTPIAAVKPDKPAKRNISPEGRKRIAEAVKRRWALQKKAAAVAAK
jgi:hypothetical protein